jgi:hypothetical protein
MSVGGGGCGAAGELRRREERREKDIEELRIERGSRDGFDVLLEDD